jgi:hypothetical protein
MSTSKSARFALRHSFVLRHSCFVIFRPLDESFPDENKDAGGQRDNIEEENSRPEIQAEP